MEIFLVFLFIEISYESTCSFIAQRTRFFEVGDGGSMHAIHIVSISAVMVAISRVLV